MFDLETPEHLKRLTTRELIKLADQAGIEIPPDLDRIFIIRELLDNVYDAEAPLEVLAEKPNLKTAQLPEQYHITYLEVLPRDPQWVHVFWEIKAQDRERLEADSRFEGYALKILECKTKDGNFTESFTVPVKPEDNSRYLGLSGGKIFRIALWAQGLDTLVILSRSFALPRSLNSAENEAYISHPLIKLSGAEDMAVLRNADRISHNRL